MREDQTMDALQHLEIEKYLADFHAAGYCLVNKKFRLIAQEDHVPVVSVNTQALLSFLAGLSQPQLALELGTGYGISTAAILEAAPKAQIISFDLSQDRQRQAESYLSELGLMDRCTLVCADFREDSFTSILQDRHFDFVFIDAAKGQFDKLLECIYPFILPEGLIVFDNVFINGWVIEGKWPNHRQKTAVQRMQEFLSKISADSRFSKLLLPLDDGALVLKKKGEEDEHGSTL
jgi:predicted O-methyltransferase YrrM